MSEINTENSIEEQGIPEVRLQVETSETVQAPVDTSLSISGQAADAAAVGAALAALQTTLEAAIAALFPVGAIYGTTANTAPAFYGTWVEVLVPMTHGDIEDGTRSYVSGENTGNLHVWRRTA